MSWISKLFADGGGKLLDGVDKILGKAVSDADKRIELRKEVLELINVQMGWVATEINANMQVTLAELQQDDKFTKRARPWIVYSGLIMAGIETIFRIIFMVMLWPKTINAEIINELLAAAASLPSIVPGQFWTAWTGVVAVYGIGRSVEKLGMDGKLGKLASAVSGGRTTKRLRRLLDDSED